MNLPNLSELYDILSWHKERPEPGKHVGVFIPIPKELAKYFPKDGREGEDDSPQHISVIYIGDFNSHFEDKLKNVLQNVCSQFRPFKVKISSKPRKFVNDKNQTVLHMPIFSQKLKKLHYSMKDELMKNAINVSNKYPDFKPHTTLEYVNEGDKPKYKKFRFSENKEFVVENVWIWRNK